MQNGPLKAFLYKIKLIPAISKIHQWTYEIKKCKKENNSALIRKFNPIKTNKLSVVNLSGKRINVHRQDFYTVSNYNTLSKVRIDAVYKKFQSEYSSIIEGEFDTVDYIQDCNIIWICWFQGEENAPPLVKACINSMRVNLPDKDIVVISNDNISQYIELPKYIIDKYKKGIIGPAHFSDLIRIELLTKYGGIWADATVLCTSKNIPDAILKSKLFVFQEMDLVSNDKNSIIASSWFIISQGNQRILLLTKKLLYEYWKKANKIDDYFIFHIFFAIAARRYSEDFDKVPMYNNHSPHTLQFELSDNFDKERWDEILKMSCFHKLNRHNDYTNNKESFYYHILEEYLPN